jgi:hypothetical protein
MIGNTGAGTFAKVQADIESLRASGCSQKPLRVDDKIPKIDNLVFA